jgi:O-antigen ligase
MLVNDAHNDYLELVMEAGLPAALGICLFFCFFVVAGFRIMRGAFGEQRALAGSAFVGITMILLHSLVDYPLRMIAISTTLAFLSALVIPAARPILGLVDGEDDSLSPKAEHV